MEIFKILFSGYLEKSTHPENKNKGCVLEKKLVFEFTFDFQQPHQKNIRKKMFFRKFYE